MNRRWICNDVWMDILPSFERVELGLKMALLSYRYDSLVDKHFDEKSELTIWRTIKICVGIELKAKLSVENDDTFGEFPLPDHPLPNKIRFKDLWIDYIDHSVIEFLHANKQIWDRSGTKLTLEVWSYVNEDVHPIWDVLASEIWPIFATNIRHLSFTNGDHLDNLRRRTSPTILTDVNHLNSIDSGRLCPDGIADFDGPNASAGQALTKFRAVGLMATGVGVVFNVLLTICCCSVCCIPCYICCYVYVSNQRERRFMRQMSSPTRGGFDGQMP